MAVSASTFIGEFPEFTGAPDELVEEKIAAATARTHAATFGTATDQAILYLTAQLLARSPYGRAMKMVLEKGGTAYDDTLTELRIAATAGRR